jgi:hypothetical protein
VARATNIPPASQKKRRRRPFIRRGGPEARGARSSRSFGGTPGQRPCAAYACEQIYPDKDEEPMRILQEPLREPRSLDSSDGRTRPRRKETPGRELVTWFERVSSMQGLARGAEVLRQAVRNGHRARIGDEGPSGTEYACFGDGLTFLVIQGG